MSQKYLYLNTIGCQMNVYDSERIAQALNSIGYELTDAMERAGLILMNTCAIRQKTEQKVFSFLGRAAGLKKKNPNLIIGVGGCVAQQEGERILDRAPFVDVVFGTRALGRLPRIIEQIEQHRNRIVDVDMSSEPNDFEAALNADSVPGVTRFVTVMQGCDNFCAYCVVPYVRGRETSRHPEHILKEIRNLVDSGVREVTLLGQNVNSYGQKEGWCSFSQLLAQIHQIDGLYRIRFTTSHPKDLSDDLIESFNQLEKLCHHIHLPVQSGSNAVLQRMNRKYTREQYLEKIAKLRRFCPDIAVTSDIIAGFPGETESDFEQTLDLMRTVEYDGLYAFKYSDRPNVPAAQFPNKVPETEKQHRLEQILTLQDQHTRKKNTADVGTIQEVLVEGVSKKSDGIDEDQPDVPIQMMGRTSANRIVNFIPEQDTMPGMLLQVKIENAFSHSLWGKAIRRIRL